MAENEIPFEATLQDQSLTVGIDSIAEALSSLDEITVGVGNAMSEAFDRAEAAFSNAAETISGLSARLDETFRAAGLAAQALAQGTDEAAGAVGPLGVALDEAAGAAEASVAGLDGLEGAMRGVGDAAGLLNADVVDAVGGLADLGDAAATTGEEMNTLVDESDRVGSAFAMIAGAAGRGMAGLNALGSSMMTTDEETGRLAGGIGDFFITMAGFTVINDAVRGLEAFGDSAIYGNMRIERLQATLAALTGSKGAAQAIVDWSYAFGRSIPDTTEHLQQAIVTIASLGINVQQFMPYLATMAGVMGQDLPTAATAFLDAFETDRFFMLQRRLRVTKEELEAFGLAVDKHGKIIKDTLVPAFEALVKAKFPQGLSDIMGTLSGELSNMTDQMQQLGMAFGKPVFDAFEQILFGIIAYINANHDAIWSFATAVGDVLGGALQMVIPYLGQLVQFLQNNHEALAAVGAVIMGLLIGAVVVLGSALAGLVGVFTGTFAIATVIGSILSGLAMVFIHLYQTSEPLRQTVQQLWQALEQLGRAVGGVLLDAFHSLLGPLQGITGHLGDLFGHFDHAEGPINMFGRASRTAAGAAKDLGDRLEYVRGPLSGVIDFAQRVADHISHLANAISKGDYSGFTGAIDHIRSILQTLLPFAAAIGPAFLAGAGALQVFGFHAGSLRQFLTALHNVFQIITTVAGDLLTRFSMMGPLFQMIADALVPVIQFFIDLWTVLSGGGALTALMSAASAAANALWLLVAPMLPIIAAVVAVAAAVASVVIAFIYWWQTSEGFRNMLAGMLGLILSLGGVLMSSLKPAWEQIQSSLAQLRPVWDQLVAAFQQMQPLLIFIGTIIIGVLVVAFGLLFGVIKGVLSAIGPVIAGLIQMFTGVVQIVAGVITFIVTLVSGIFNIIKDIFTGDGASLAKDWDNLWHGLLNSLGTILTGIWNLISGFFGGLWGGISGLIGGFVSGVIDWFKNLADTLVGHSIIPDMILAIIKWIASLPGAVIGFITGMIATVITAILGWRDQAIHFVMDMVTGILQAAISLELEIIVTINRMVNMAIAAILHWRDEGIALVRILVSGFISLVLSLYSQATGLISSMVNAVVSFISGMVSRVVSFVVNMVNSFAGVFRGLIGTASGIASNIVSAIGGVIGGLAGSMARWASDAVAGFIGIFSGLVDKARQIASDAAAAIAGFLHHSKPDEGPMADDDKWMPDFVDMMAQGISGNKDKLTKAATDAASSMKQQLAASLNDTTLSAQVTNRIAGSAGSAGGSLAVVKDNGKGSGDTSVVVNMHLPDSFAAGFALLDGESRRNLAKQLSDSLSEEMARQTDRQMLVSNGYAGNSRS
jgi:phage-related protein